MRVVSARTFRTNLGEYLTAARDGQSVLLTSRYGNFKIMPITEEDALTNRVGGWLEQAKLVKEGKMETRPIEDLFNEL